MISNLPDSLPVLARAKINLYLHVVGRRADGYHLLDSLGWAFYRMGRYDDAVRTLEKAIELKPNDATINNHLGDAYWRVGRKAEARFQWSRALNFKPEPDTVGQIETKIEKGLDAVPAKSTQQDG